MTRQSLLTTALTLATLLASQNSFALAKLSAQCETKDGRYEISVFDKQGTGLERQSDLGAEIRDAKTGKLLAAYEVETRRNGAIGFNPLHYIDVATSGEDFNLSGSSINVHGFSFEGKLENGKRIRAESVECSVFGGANQE